MIEIKSERAKKILNQPRFLKTERDELMKKFPGNSMMIWVSIEWEHHNVKKLSFFGELEKFQIVLLESMASLLINKPIIKLDDLTLRECEAFLRDKNSEPAITGMTESEEAELKKLFQWIRNWPKLMMPKEYTFSSEKGPFRQLRLVDKIKEVKAFLNTPEILTLYANLPTPTLVDVEELTVYIHAPYESQREKSLFDELHILGVQAFQEEDLNFIPDAP